MEGRVPPAGDENNGDLPLNSDDSETRSPPRPLAGGKENSETYVVQIPRDQVYRVPPPEHARIVESYRKPAQERSSCCGGGGGAPSCCCWIILALVGLALLGGIFLGVSHLTLRPKSPEFHLTSIQAKNLEPQSGNKRNNNNNVVQFELNVVASNPNSRIDFKYKDGGRASLAFKEHVIGEGEFQQVSQGSEESSDVGLTLEGTKDASSNKEIHSALINDSRNKSLTLKIEVSIEMKSWIKTTSRDTTVTCDFTVNSLEKKVKILSESCHTDF